jgi:exodeoxyribonuclease-5
MIPGDVQEGQYFGAGSLLSDLITYVYESDSNCKILFLGDTAQLPPVGASESPALNPTYLQDHFGLKVFSAELKEVLRQEKKSGILENATALREQLLAENISKPSMQVKNFKDFFYITGEKLVDGINYAYDHFGMDETLIICRSNKNANLYNQQIRARILFREEFISSGDFLMVVKNNYHWLPESSDGEFIANGEIAKVIRIRNEQEMYGLKFADASLQLVDFPTQPIITAKIILDTLDSDSPALSNAQQKHLYEQVALDYSDIKNKSERLAKIKTDPYYNALQVKFSYAVTCHKSQGGQWKAVFVDQGYLTDELVNKEFIRWLYTAITRASEQLFLVNFNKDFIVDLPKDNF